MILAFIAVIVFRSSVAEWIVGQHCKSRDLTCRLSIESLDAGRVALSDVLVRDSDNEIVRVGAADIILSWDGLTPKVVSVAAQRLMLVLDLTGEGPVLGGLQRLSGGAGSGELPKVDVEDAELRLRTPGGELVANGDARVDGLRMVDLSFSASEQALQNGDRRIVLSGGEASLAVNDEGAAGRLSFRVKEAAAPGFQIWDADVDVGLRTESGEAALTGRASLSRGEGASARVEALTSTADAIFRIAPSDMARPAAWLTGLRDASLALSTKEGGWGEYGWTSLDAAAAAPSGDATEQPAPSLFSTRATATGVASPYGRAQSLSVDGGLRLSPLPAGAAPGLSWNGAVSFKGADASDADWTKALASMEAAPTPLKPAARLTRREIDRFLSAFDGDLPVTLAREGGKLSLSSSGPANAIAADGAQLTIAPAGDAPILSFRSGEGWRLAGQGRFASDGVDLDARDFVMAGGGGRFELSGGFDLKPVKAEGASVSMVLPELKVISDSTGLSLSAGDAAIAFSGEAYGGDWRKLRLAGGLSLRRAADGQSRAGWAVEAPQGLRVKAERLGLGPIGLGPFDILYKPETFLAQVDDDGARGKGRLSTVVLPVDVSGRRYDLTSRTADISWTATSVIAADLVLAPLAVDFELGDRPASLSAPRVKARFQAGDGWSISGAFEDGGGQYAPVVLTDLSSAFAFGSKGGDLEGKIAPMKARLSDIETKTRFAPMDFAGGLVFRDGRISGEGRVVEVSTGVALANLSITHSLSEGAGGATIRPTVIRFTPRGLQPATIFPILRGLMANVGGAATVSGAVGWGRGDLQSSGAIELTDMGFVSGKAGLFEGVFGRVAFTDLFNAISAPTQTVIIHQWNPGAPFENGRLTFQIDGLKHIILESADWPFAGGRLKAGPADWYVSNEVNRIVVRAEKLDLTDLVKRTGLPDTTATGVMSGILPVVFTTGSVDIEGGELKATEGVISYRGKLPGGAQESNENVKMLFAALSDFRYQIMRIGMNGRVTGDMVLSLLLQGHNPAVLEGYPFELNVTLTANLMSLMNTRLAGEREVDELVGAISRRPLQDKGR